MEGQTKKQLVLYDPTVSFYTSTSKIARSLAVAADGVPGWTLLLKTVNVVCKERTFVEKQGRSGSYPGAGKISIRWNLFTAKSGKRMTVKIAVARLPEKSWR